MGWGKSRRIVEFVPEWGALGLLALLIAAWANQIGFHLTVTRNDFYGLGILLAAMLALRLFWMARGGMMAEFCALSLVAGAMVCVLSYLCLASSGALIDDRLLAMDRALGFDWLAGYRFVQARPWLSSILRFAYYSPMLQAFYFCVLLGLMNRKGRMREMFWLVLLSGLCACLGALLAPALGPFHRFGIITPDSFLPQMQQLIDGRDRNFAFAHLTGVVSFPSFHTSMALGYAWGFRRTGPAGWAIAALNLVMLLSVPFFGGHYLVDMIAGATAMLMALALIHGVRERLLPVLAWRPSPVTAEN